ncbi:MAG: GNAT family N-acetyltransferase, partial [Firmicutes bacterium]|nr:GNAT family N-acetyltransferase [Bacillota bacterium]
VFPRMSPEYWADWSRGQVTAAVAIRDGEVVGAVPFQFRDFLIRPGVSVPVAWEYSVCTREDVRGTGVGSRLMEVAAEFLRGRCLAMMVYREDERSRAYRFYRRTGHEDLAYLTSWVREPAPVWPSEAVRRVAYAEFLEQQERAVDLFRSAYGNQAGYPPRFCGYYEVAVQTPQYEEVPLDLSVLQVPAEGSMRGYAVIG